MNGYCNIHQVPLLLKRMNGGWTTVCPWCDQLGRYDNRTAQVAAHEPRGYQYRSTGGSVDDRADTNTNRREGR